jgi:hypothetical protein
MEITKKRDFLPGYEKSKAVTSECLNFLLRRLAHSPPFHTTLEVL